MQQIVCNVKKNITIFIFIFLLGSAISAFIFIDANIQQQFMVDFEDSSEVSLDIEFIGLEDIIMYVGDTYYFRKNVEILINGEKGDAANVVVFNAQGEEISSIPSVRFESTGVYQYTYIFIDESGESYKKVRTVTCKVPEIVVELEELGADIICLRYKITNESSFDLQLYMEDWSMFDPNHKEFKTTLPSNEIWEGEFVYKLIPVYQDSSDIPELDNGEINTANPNRLMLYFMGESVGFMPTFYFARDDIFFEGFQLTEAILYDTTELYTNRGMISNNLIQEVLFTNTQAKVGEKITLYAFIKNINDFEVLVYIEDWSYFLPFEKHPLGTIQANSEEMYEIEIEVTPNIIDNYGNIAISYPTIHYYGVSSPQLLAYQTILQFKGIVDIRYKDEHGKELVLPDLLIGEHGETYQTVAKELVGYTLKGSPENAIGEFSEQKINVTYEYQKIESISQEKEEPDNNYGNPEIDTKDIEQSVPPKTADLNSFIVLQLGFIISAILLVFYKVE